jgi:phosphinothricin acetyltransferase
MHIINAEEQHIPAIRRIYAHHVLHGTGSFETAPPNTQEMLARVKTFSHVDFHLVYRPAGAEKPYSIMP